MSDAFEEAYHRCYAFPKVGEGTPNQGPCYKVAQDMWEESRAYHLKLLADTLRKVLPPALLREVMKYTDPPGTFLTELRDEWL